MAKHRGKQKKLKLKPNYWVGIVLCILGLLTASLPYFLQRENEQQGVAIGIGVTAIISGLISMITGYFEHRNWRAENLLRHTILDVLMFEQLEAMRNIRYEQKIILTIEKVVTMINDNPQEEYIKITCEHSYTYKNESNINKNIIIDIFNDIFIPADTNGRKPYERTNFNSVCFDDKTTYTPEKNPDKFERLRDGRPHFRGNIKLESNKEVKLKYSITNEFLKFSRLVWNIQELSEDITLEIIDKASCDLSKFTLVINHPNRETIHEKNKQYLDAKCSLKKSSEKTKKTHQR